MRKKTNYNLSCVDCQAPFVAHHPKALRCDKCKAERIKQKSREYIQHTRDNERRNIQAANPHLPSLSIPETIILCEEYNKKHGTRYWYGEFVAKCL